MLRTTAMVLMLVGLLIAAAGLIHEQRKGKRRFPRPAFALLMTALLLGATGTVLALIGTAIE